MGNCKIVYEDKVLIDLSWDSVTPETLDEGVTAHDKDGNPIVGTRSLGSGGITPTGIIKIDENGIYDVTSFATAEVNVPSKEPALQSKTVSPTTSQQSVKPDDGFDGMDEVTVNAMPAATQATPSITVSESGLITAKATQDAGYVISGTKSATKQLTTKGATTITPGTTVKTAVAAGTYVTGDIKVAAVQSSGGGTVETCSLTFDMSKTSENSIYVYYATVENDAIAIGGKRIEATTSITVVKNTPLFLQYDVYDEYSNLIPTANASMEIMFDMFWGFTITGDATITADTY